MVDSPGRDRGLFGVGGAAQVARLLDRAAEEEPGSVGSVRYATLARGAWDATGEAARSVLHVDPEGSSWDWMWTDRPLGDADPSGAERLPLTPAAAAEVAELLHRAHPTASTAADDERLLGWWGVRQDGRLMAVIGAVVLAPGLPGHLVSLGVDPAVRGQRLAGVVMAAAVRDILGMRPAVGEPMVSLGLYAHNDVARRVYLRHGFELRHRFTSRRRLPSG